MVGLASARYGTLPKRGIGKRIVNISGRFARHLRMLDNSERTQRFQTIIFIIKNINLLKPFVDSGRTVNTHLSIYSPLAGTLDPIYNS